MLSFIFLMLPLASCAMTQGASKFMAVGCLDDAEERLDGIDWDTAWKVELRIRQDEFNPMVVNMVENSPVVLRIINDDDSKHAVRASEFFRSVALESVSVGDRMNRSRCIDAIVVPANKTAELRMMPTRYGRYDFVDSALLLPKLSMASAAGVFVIEPYKSYYIKPLPYSQEAPAAEPVVVTPGKPEEETAPGEAPSIFEGEPGVEEPAKPGEKEAKKQEGPAETAPGKPAKPAAPSSEEDNIVIFDDPEEFQ